MIRQLRNTEIAKKEIIAGGKDFANAVKQFMLIKAGKADATNLRHKKAVLKNIDTAMSKFDTAMQKISADNPLYDRAVFELNKALRFRGATGEFFKEDLLPSGAINRD